MGLMKLSGDLYNYEEDTKIAMGVESMDTNQVAPNNLADKQPQQISAPAQPVQATLKQPAPNVPTAPVPAPEQDIYMPNQKSLPPLPPNTRYASYEGSKMSRLKRYLNKQAMTQEDLDSGYSNIPQEYVSEAELFPQLRGDSSVQNYSVPSDYSNYMAARAPVSQDNDIGTYSDIPPEQYTDADLQQAYMDAEDDFFYPDESMSYSPYSQGSYQSMGYDPYQAYARYEQMYASPSSGGGDYQDIQTQAAEPQVDPAQEAYQQSYDEIYNYLVQMGYSPEEAAAAAPSLLEQVNVSSPQLQQKQASVSVLPTESRVMTKTASVTFNSRANQLKASYVEAGYSPYQAQQMSLEIVIPEAEKYASLAGRVIGGSLGAIGGAMAGGSRYDTEEGDDKGKILGAVLGAGLGGAFGGRVPAYFGKHITSAGEISKLRKVQADIFNQQLAQARSGKFIGKNEAPSNFKELVTAHLRQKGINTPTAAERATAQKAMEFGLGNQFNEASQVIKSLNSGNTIDQARALRALKVQGGLAELGKDVKVTGGTAAGLALPAYFADKAMRGTGKDNIIDSSIDAADELGGKAIEKAKETGSYLGEGVDTTLEIIKNNPELMLALAGTAAATPLAISKLREYKNPPKKGGRSKKAHIENSFNKQASVKALAARTLGGALLGAGTQTAMDYSVMPEYVKEDDELYSQGLRAAALRGALGGALLGGLGSVGGGAVAGRLGKAVPVGANIGAGSALALGTAASAIPALMYNRDFEGKHSKGKRTFWDDFLGRNVREGLMEKGNIETERMKKQKEQYDKDEEKLKKQREKERRQYLSPQEIRDRKEYDKYKAEQKAEADRLKVEEEANAKRRAGQTFFENLQEDIMDDPVRAALIAGGTGAGLYGLYNLATSGPAESTNERLMRMYQQQQLMNKYRR